MAEARRLDADPKTARSDGVTYAEIASLRIGLAFDGPCRRPVRKMSNQDVQQLERLGSNFNTPEEVYASWASLSKNSKIVLIVFVSWLITAKVALP